MLHRNKKENDIHEGKWVAPGGKFEKGESPEDCIVREFKEETGLELKSPILRAVLTFPGFGDDDWYVFLFTCNNFSGEILDNSPEGHLQWVEINKIAELPMHKGDYIFINELSKTQFFSGKFNYKNNEFIDCEIVDYS